MSPPEVKEDFRGARLIIHARNLHVATFASIIGGIFATIPAAMVMVSIVRGRFDLFVMFIIVFVGICWLIWRIGWRRLKYEIYFRSTGIEVAGVHHAYNEIEDFGISDWSGGAFDPLSMPVPQNTVLGDHVYVRKSGNQVPVTVALKKGHAREALRLFTKMMEKHGRQSA